MTRPQQLARAPRLHDRAGKGTEAATEASSVSLASTGSVGSGEGSRDRITQGKESHPGATKQPACLCQAFWVSAKS